MYKQCSTPRTMSDFHPEVFPQQSYSLYQQLVIPDGQPTWKQSIQKLIKQIVHDYYTTEPQRRTTHQILLLLDKYKSKLEISLFHSSGHFYSVLAIVCNRLMEVLLPEKDEKTFDKEFEHWVNVRTRKVEQLL